MNVAFAPGDVILVGFPSRYPKGHEQEGSRLAIVVGLPQEPIRFPVCIVVPLTTADGLWVDENPRVYHRLPRGTAGLYQTSVALVDQVCSVDARRIKGFFGSLPEDKYESIRQSLLLLFQKST